MAAARLVIVKIAGKQKVRFDLICVPGEEHIVHAQMFWFDDTNVEGIFATSKPSFDVFNYAKPSFN